MQGQASIFNGCSAATYFAMTLIVEKWGPT